MIRAILWFMESLYAVLQHMAWFVLDLLFSLCWYILEPLVNTLVQIIPADAVVIELAASFLYYLKFVEYWVPVTFMFGLLIIYWIFVGAFSSIKIIIKLIPTVG